MPKAHSGLVLNLRCTLLYFSFPPFHTLKNRASGKEIQENILTVNALLILKVRDIIFFSRANVTIQALHRVKNILVITELIITTLSDWVLLVKLSHATEGLCAYLKK